MPLQIIYGHYFWTWELLLKHPKKRWVRCFLSMSLCSQYTSLWSVSNSPLNGGTNSSLSPQFLRGSCGHYPSLSHSVTVPSSGSPMYDSGTVTEVHDAAQYDSSPQGRLPSAWTPVTPPSLWWKHLWINTKLKLYNTRFCHITISTYKMQQGL